MPLLDNHLPISRLRCRSRRLSGIFDITSRTVVLNIHTVCSEQFLAPLDASKKTIGSCASCCISASEDFRLLRGTNTITSTFDAGCARPVSIASHLSLLTRYT